MNGPAQSYIPHGTTGWYTLAWQTIGHVFERTWHAELSSSGLRSAAVQVGVGIGGSLQYIIQALVAA